MTALAMIIGMAPMALGLGEGGEQNAPLGRAVIGGLIFATIATLIFVPVVFSVIHRHHGKTAAAPLPTEFRMSPESPSGAPRKPARRGLAIAGLAGLLVVVFVVASGIWNRNASEAELKEWTDSPVRPDRERRDAGHGANKSVARPAGPARSLCAGADLCPRQRLPEGLVRRYRRAGESRPAAGRDRGARPRPAAPAGQGGAGQRPGGRGTGHGDGRSAGSSWAAPTPCRARPSTRRPATSRSSRRSPRPRRPTSIAWTCSLTSSASRRRSTASSRRATPTSAR